MLKAIYYITHAVVYSINITAMKSIPGMWPCKDGWMDGDGSFFVGSQKTAQKVSLTCYDLVLWFLEEKDLEFTYRGQTQGATIHVGRTR